MNNFILYVVGILFNINVYIIKLLPRKSIVANDSILVVQPDKTLGDKVWAIDFLRVICEIYKNRQITFISDGTIDEKIQEQCPNANIVPFKVNSDKGIHLLWRIPKVLAFCKKNNISGFQKAYIPRIQDDQYAVFIAYASGAKEIIGFSEKSNSRKSIVNKSQDKLLTHPYLPPNHSYHNLTRQLFLLKNEKETSNFLNEKKTWKPSLALKKLNKNNTKNIVICPSHGHSKLKAWPIDYYVKLIQLLKKNISDINVTLLGGKNDLSTANQIVELVKDVHNLTGKLTLTDTIKEIEKNDIYIGADSGLLHIADALGLRCIGIFGSSCHHQFHPFRNQQNTITLSLECNPCNTGHLIDRCVTCSFQPAHPCMEGIKPEMVFSKIENIIKDNAKI